MVRARRRRRKLRHPRAGRDGGGVEAGKVHFRGDVGYWRSEVWKTSVEDIYINANVIIISGMNSTRSVEFSEAVRKSLLGCVVEENGWQCFGCRILSIVGVKLADGYVALCSVCRSACQLVHSTLLTQNQPAWPSSNSTFRLCCSPLRAYERGLPE
jgi:hypothetical protein